MGGSVKNGAAHFSYLLDHTLMVLIIVVGYPNEYNIAEILFYPVGIVLLFDLVYGSINSQIVFQLDYPDVSFIPRFSFI